MRTELYRILSCWPLAVCLLLSSVGSSLAEQQSTTGAAQDRQQTKQPPPRDQRLRTDRPQTVKPYVPSEKVSADKSVSFPVDI